VAVVVASAGWADGARAARRRWLCGAV